MSEIMKILEMIEKKEISSEEGEELLSELRNTAPKNEASSTLAILGQLENGTVSIDEALNAFQNAPTSNETDREVSILPLPSKADSPISEEELEKWKSWWTIPFYTGIGIVVLCTYWLNSAYTNSGYGFWFFCAWLPLLLGILLITLSWQRRSGTWIHIRVKGPKERVAISIPVPFGLTSWALNNFGHFIPHMDASSIEEILDALEHSRSSDTPFYIQVDEEDGDQVEIYIG